MDSLSLFLTSVPLTFFLVRSTSVLVCPSIVSLFVSLCSLSRWLCICINLSSICRFVAVLWTVCPCLLQSIMIIFPFFDPEFQGHRTGSRTDLQPSPRFWVQSPTRFSDRYKSRNTKLASRFLFKTRFQFCYYGAFMLDGFKSSCIGQIYCSAFFFYILL